MRTGYVIPRDVNDADTRVGKGGEGVGKEVEVVGAAARAFVDDLLLINQGLAGLRIGVLTMAVIDFPP